MKKIFVYILLFAFTSLNISCVSKSGKQNDKSEFLSVTKVIDGDTFWADDGSEKGIKIRLIGVDAPESRKTGKKEIGYFGREAKEFLNKLLSGKR